MKRHTNYFLMGLCFVGLCSPLQGLAATLWTGSPLTFVNLPGSDPTQPANQDRMTPDVWITRGASQGIYNAALEGGFTHFQSPVNTEWSDGVLANYASLTYHDWNTWAKNIHLGPPNTVGVSAVVHLISEDIYLSLTFRSWGGSGGGFTYDRSTPAAANQPPTVSITFPTNGASFTAPATVAINADASDTDGTVTNVSFFDGTTFLGQTNNTPYTVTSTFAAGSHPLTAVATDNGGLSTTSSVVNISVSVAPTLQITQGLNQVVLSWTNDAFHLQAATNVTGPYTTVPSATSPYTNSTSNQQLFFRLIN